MFLRQTRKLVLIALLTTLLAACGQQTNNTDIYATVPASAANISTTAASTSTLPGASATAHVAPATATGVTTTEAATAAQPSPTAIVAPTATTVIANTAATVTANNNVISATASVTTTQAVAPAANSFPLRVSDDKRHLAYSNGTPFFYMADTPWRITTEMTHDDVELYLNDRKAKGFTVIQVMLLPIIHLSNKNLYGEYPFTDADHFDLTKPNEAYFQNVDWIFNKAAEKGIVLLVNPAWFGQREDNWYKYLTPANVQTYGQFLGNRYKNYNNLMWFLGGDYKPDGKFTEIRRLAETLKQLAPQQMISFHAGPEVASSSVYFQNDAWFDFSICYTYDIPARYIIADYNKTPRKPVIFGEGGYEDESIDGKPGNAHRVRSQAYWSMLSGAAGQAMGNRNIWLLPPGWQSSLQSPGAQSMAYVRNLLTNYDWFNLAPDQQHAYLTGGRELYEEYVAASYTPDGNLLLAYSPNKVTLKVNLARFSATVRAMWYDPTNGKYQLIADKLSNTGEREFTSPDKNAAGDGDFVLVIETAAAAGSKSYGNTAFFDVWHRTDAPVATGAASRSYLWGPAPNTGLMSEQYTDSPGGGRFVQYFDKSRMEINDPLGNPTLVTNGLMARELISGQMQLGNNRFEAKTPSLISVAGDFDDTTGPTYKTLTGLLGQTRDKTGLLVGDSLDRAGTTRSDAAELGRQFAVEFVYYDRRTGHNIASPFWTFLNQTGPVLDPAGQLIQSRLFEPQFFATGLPITEPYWAKVKVAGRVQDVLIQAFERRVLTYTPGNSPAFQVEMGNIGLHYYNWRYGI